MRAAILAVGLALSLVLAFATASFVAREEAAERNAAGQSLVAGLQGAVDRRIEFLQAIKGLFEASDFVTAAEFGRFTRLDDRIRAQAWWAMVAWAPRLVPGAEGELPRPSGPDAAEAVVVPRSLARDGGGRSELRAGIPAYPMAYVEPSRRRSQFQDGDLASRPDWRAAIEDAERDGAAFAVETTSITLHGIEHPAMLVLVPVDAPVVPPRRIGFIVGVFVTAGLVEDYMVASGLEGAFRLRLFNTDREGRSVSLYQSPDARIGNAANAETESPAELAADGFQSMPIKIERRRWIALVAPISGQRNIHLWLASAIFLLGAGVSLAIYVNLERARTDYERIAVEVGRATAELNRANSELAVRSGTLERLAADLRQKTYEAELANTAKTMFLAHMSHEFRTPLNAILGFSEIIAQQGLGQNLAKYADYAHSIHASGGQLLAIIDDLLDLSRLELGEAQLREETVTVVDLAREAVALAERDVPGGLGVVEGLAASDPGGLYGLLPVRADRRLLREAVAILMVQAALRRTGPDPVRLTATADPATGLWLAVTMRAEGVGADVIDDLMSPFWLQRADVARASGGRGLGLIVARRFLEAHGGTVEVTSKTDGVLTIALRLPPERVVLPAAPDLPVGAVGAERSIKGEKASHGRAAGTRPPVRS